MSRKPRFLICRNDVVTSREFILHTKTPRFLAEIFPFDDKDEAVDFRENTPLSSYIQIEDKYYVAAVRELYEGGIDARSLAESLLLGRMTEWLRFYLKKEKTALAELEEF
ncbi:MAG: hypothetical protein ACEPOW_12140 [Bacteroidales bacterium]